MTRWIALLLFLGAVAIGLLLGILNPDRVVLDLLIFELPMPLGALVLIALVIGVLSGLVLALLLFALPRRLKSGSKKTGQGGGDKSLTRHRDA